MAGLQNHCPPLYKWMTERKFDYNTQEVALKNIDPIVFDNFRRSRESGGYILPLLWQGDDEELADEIMMEFKTWQLAQRFENISLKMEVEYTLNKRLRMSIDTQGSEPLPRSGSQKLVTTCREIVRIVGQQAKLHEDVTKVYGGSPGPKEPYRQVFLEQYSGHLSAEPEDYDMDNYAFIRPKTDANGVSLNTFVCEIRGPAGR